MTRKEIKLVGAGLVLAALYVCFFTDWISPPPLEIMMQLRPPLFRGRPGQVYQVSFSLEERYAFNSVKVVPLAAFKADRHTPPVWHLVAGPNRVPSKGFVYGQPIPGMRPAVTNTPPQRLQPDVPYRLLVQSGRRRGQIDFKTQAISP